jgi:hypothetical protein
MDLVAPQFAAGDEPGFLVNETDMPPALLKAHTPHGQGESSESCGMQQKLDCYAWRVSLLDLGPNLEFLPEQLLRVTCMKCDGCYCQP